MRKSTKTRRRPSSNAVPVSIIETLPELGIDVDKITGGEAWATCPGHVDRLGRQDNSASWSINLDTGAHNCFSCGFGGNYVDLVRWMKGWEDDPDQAEEWTRKHGGIAVASRKMKGLRAYEKRKAQEVTEVDLMMFEEKIPRWALTERDLEPDSCAAYGIRWDAENDRWIIPVRDPVTGKLRGWQAKGDGYFNNYPQYMEKADTLFGYHLLRKGDDAYLEESPLDCVRLHSWNVEVPVSGYGVHVSDVQLGLIAERAKRLIVCLDNDDAGRRKEAEIWTEWRGRLPLFFANYDHVQGSNYKKDHGEMGPDEIEYSLEEAVSALRFRPRGA